MSQSDFVTRGQALVSSGQYQEAVKVCRLGLLGRPTTVEGRVVLGQALLALKRYDEVLAEMRVALELDHGSVPAQVLKGEALLRKGDGHGAAEVLGKLRSQGLADGHTIELLAEAERLASRSPPGSPGASLGLPGADPAAAIDHGTKNYPSQVGDGGGESELEGAGEFTRPTSLAAPGARKRSSPDFDGPPTDASATPPPAVLAVGDHSGTVEVDRNGAQLRGGDDDLGDTVGPPVAGGRGRPTGPRSAPMSFAPEPATDTDNDFDDLDAAATGVVDRARAVRALAGPPSITTEQPTRSSRSPLPAPGTAKKSRRAPMFKEEVSTVELTDDEVIELDEPRSPAPRLFEPEPATSRSVEPERATSRRTPGRSAVRNAVKLPSGPLDLPVAPPAPAPAPVVPQAASSFTPPNAAPVARPIAAPAPPHLAQLIANQPHVMNVMPAPPAPLNPRSAIAAALPTAAALPMPSPPMAPPGMTPGSPPHLAQTMLAPPGPVAMAPISPASAVAAARPTIALNAQQQQSAAAVDALFHGGDGQAQAWGRGPASFGPDDSGRNADPGMHVSQGSGGVPMVGFGGESSSISRSGRTARRARPRLIVLWLLISTAVISAGVFAGFQIRGIRLHRQIDAARDRAAELARADTWPGWIAARDGFTSIAAASPTADNKAAVARARGVLAFEFGDGLADARAAVDGLGRPAGGEVELAVAYIALAQGDPKAAHDAAERAVQAAPGDAAALYVSGQAALLAGDVKAAITALRGAVEREPRPHYLVGLARALGESAAWDEAIATADRARDNPGAVIARGVLLARAGRVTPGPGAEIRAQLAKLIGDGGRPNDQVSPLQIALAELALARVDHARGDAGAAHADYLGSLSQKLGDLQFAEELGDTVLAIGELEAARTVATRTLKDWPASRRARIALAEIAIAQGKPADAVEVFTRAPELAAGPVGQTVRGRARLAAGDIDSAKADFDTALKKLPGYEPAVIARTWLDLAAGDVDAARQRVEPRFNAKTASAGLATVYAAVLRATGEPEARDKARLLLERAVTGSVGPDTARARLELARIDRELGDLAGARAAYTEAARAGSADARLESATLLIDNRDPRGGHETLEELLKDARDHAPAALLLEAARARTLMGDHKGAFELLARADKAPGVVRWQLDRERGRIALRKGDTAGAAQMLSHALDSCAGDLDSFLLAADTVSADDKQAELASKLKALVPNRLKGKPEIEIIQGKLLLAADRYDDAEKHYTAAHEALVRDKASPRRVAQCDFGLGATAYFKHEDASASSRLKLTLAEDPSIDAAYLFAADLERGRDPEKALGTAHQAVEYNPDSVEGWKMVGTIAAQLPRQKKLLGEAISRVNDLAPGSEALHQLQRLR
ncbi:MAG TPA: tetratricopeptide repeat protein [Kofleriaceae bacterium]|nr:tetratricopeptide repeat protein [Kofleriaceae bacterium]